MVGRHESKPIKVHAIERLLRTTYDTTHRHDRVEAALESDKAPKNTFYGINGKAEASIAKMNVNAS